MARKLRVFYAGKHLRSRSTVVGSASVNAQLKTVNDFDPRDPPDEQATDLRRLLFQGPRALRPRSRAAVPDVPERRAHPRAAASADARGARTARRIRQRPRRRLRRVAPGPSARKAFTRSSGRPERSSSPALGWRSRRPRRLTLAGKD